MNREEAIVTLGVMKCQYSHIRQSDAEWEAIEMAQDALSLLVNENKIIVVGKPFLLKNGWQYAAVFLGDDGWPYIRTYRNEEESKSAEVEAAANASKLKGEPNV